MDEPTTHSVEEVRSHAEPATADLRRGNEGAPPGEAERASAVWPMMLLLVVAAGALVAIQMRRPRTADPFVGMALPPLDAEGWVNTSGPLTRESLRGKVVLVDFWATHCPRCLREMPELAGLHKRFGDHGFTVLGMTPESGDDAARVKQFVAAEKIDWPIGYGAGFAFEAMAIEITPTYVLFDRAGRGVWGGHSLHGLEEVLVAEVARSN